MRLQYCQVDIEEPGVGHIFGPTFYGRDDDEAMYAALGFYAHCGPPVCNQPTEQEAQDLQVALARMVEIADTMPEPWRVCTICKANGHLRPTHGSETPHAAKAEWILKSEAISRETYGV